MESAAGRSAACAAIPAFKVARAACAAVSSPHTVFEEGGINDRAFARVEDATTITDTAGKATPSVTITLGAGGGAVAACAQVIVKSAIGYFNRLKIEDRSEEHTSE